ncbi:MAG: DUF2071 domain-containing protein [Candidatus Rokubacteria bacterium]|nr:DUF2071 domain-containing protein [Candidatus Rokubacteria bacterium]
MAQTWHDLLFAHWPIAAAGMRARLPRGLELDTFEGAAWLGIVPFRMSGVRLRWTPAVPGLSAFPELNVRTYVTHDGRPGVWFFSLDAANALAVAVARMWFHLPYFRARMASVEEGEDVDYASVRVHPGGPPAELRARYGPRGAASLARSGTLDHWLTERYCLYAISRRGALLRGEIHHAPWALAPAAATIARNTMGAARGLELPAAAPHLLFARRQDVVIWPPRLASRRG